jgi:hypothetical protein
MILHVFCNKAEQHFQDAIMEFRILYLNNTIPLQMHKILSRCRGDYRQDMHWWMDLLNTYTHDSEQQVTTALPLRFTIHKSPTNTLSLYTACCIFTSHFLATTSNSGDSSAARAASYAELNPQLITTQRLTAISHLPPSLLLTGWLSNNY